MDINSLVKFLRQSISIQDPNITDNNPNYLALSDEDIILILQLALAKVDNQDNVFNIDQSNIYPTMLVAKKEIYHRLAVKFATVTTISGEAGELKKSDIFKHYYKLIEDVEKEYKNYIETGISPTVGEVLIDSRYFTRRNYELSNPPKVMVQVDGYYSNMFEISFKASNVKKFLKYALYISEDPIVDKYNMNKINIEPYKVINDIHINKFRFENLHPNRDYYICVVVEERNGLKGYCEIEAKTIHKVEPLCH